jgi:pilus assembly protein CpaE
LRASYGSISKNMAKVEEGNIRVLIVDDIPETRENLRKLLYFESDIEVVGAAASGEESVKMAKELQPHIVLMDVKMPGMNGIAAGELICQNVPTAQIIMMSVHGDVDYLRRSMLAGAKDFLIKPFTREELVSTIRRVHARRETIEQVPIQPLEEAKPKERGKVISVFGPKGGVGTSTIAVNLAIALQKEMGKEARVALVDGSLQFGDVGVLLNLHPTRSIADLATQGGGIDLDMVESAMIPHSSGIKALLAPPSPEMADLILPEHMKSILDEMRRAFDYIVIDTSTSLHDLMLMILDYSDKVVLITTPDVSSVKNTRLFFELTDALGYEEEKVLLVINMANRRGGISPKLIEENLRHKVAVEITMDERTVLSAINRGIPFVLDGRRKTISQSIFKLAEQLIRS